MTHTWHLETQEHTLTQTLLAQATSVPAQRTTGTGPSPECIMLSLAPSQPCKHNGNKNQQPRMPVTINKNTCYEDNLIMKSMMLATQG